MLLKYYNQNYMRFTEEVSGIDEEEEHLSYQFQLVNIKLIKPQYRKIKHEEPKKQERFLHYLIKYSKSTQSVFFSDQVICSSHVVNGDYSKSVVLDKYTGRYYMYDNNRSEVVVRTIRFEDEVCRWRSYIKRK